MESEINEHTERKGERIRVKKRVRVKKKSSPKSQARKILRIVLWVGIVLIFLLTLVTMVKEADIRDKDRTFGPTTK